MSQLERRVTELEQRAGVAGLDLGALAVLDKDDAAFYQGVARAVAQHKGGFESFIKTLADDEVERLAEIEIKLTDNLTMDDASRDEWRTVRADLIALLAIPQSRAQSSHSRRLATRSQPR